MRVNNGREIATLLAQGNPAVIFVLGQIALFNGKIADGENNARVPGGVPILYSFEKLDIRGERISAFHKHAGNHVELTIALIWAVLLGVMKMSTLNMLIDGHNMEVHDIFSETIKRLAEFAALRRQLALGLRQQAVENPFLIAACLLEGYREADCPRGSDEHFPKARRLAADTLTTAMWEEVNTPWKDALEALAEGINPQ